MSLKGMFKGAGAITGYVVGIIALLIGVFCISGSLTIEKRWLVLIGVFIVFTIVISIIIFVNGQKTMQEGLLYSINSFEDTNEGKIFYIDYSKSFRTNAVVTIMLKTNGHHVPFGIGIVGYSKEYEYTEIALSQHFEEYKDVFKRVQRNDKNTLEKLYAVPSVANKYVKVLPLEV